MLARNSDEFKRQGVLVLAPDEQTAAVTFDKHAFSKSLQDRGIRGIVTFDSLDDCDSALEKGSASFPLFVKPKTGSGSIDAGIVRNRTELEAVISRLGVESLVIQEYVQGEEIDVDVYVDPFIRKPVSFFAKRKLETRPGGTSKSVSFQDKTLFDLVASIVDHFGFCGPTDMEFFRTQEGEYLLIEVNARFSGAYVHAFGCGVDFFKLIERNMRGLPNQCLEMSYDEGVRMMLYDSALIVEEHELVQGGRESCGLS